jgi:hypothetical protein
MRKLLFILLIIACCFPLVGKKTSADSFDSNGVRLHYVVEGQEDR